MNILEELVAEIEGVSALASIISQPFLEHDGVPAETTAGNAIFAIDRYLTVDPGNYTIMVNVLKTTTGTIIISAK